MFCACECLLTGSKAFSTKICHNTYAPVWNETTDISISASSDCDPLRVQVYDHDDGSADDLLGEVVLGCFCFDLISSMSHPSLALALLIPVESRISPCLLPSPSSLEF